MITSAEKVEESLSVLRDALNTWEDALAVTFPGGRDSLVVLHMVRTLGDDKVPIPVFNIDTTVKFPEVLRFRDELTQRWQLPLVVLKNAGAAGGKGRKSPRQGSRYAGPAVAGLFLRVPRTAATLCACYSLTSTFGTLPA